MVHGEISIGEAAIRLGLSKRAVRERIRRGALPVVKDGRGKWRVVLAPGSMGGGTGPAEEPIGGVVPSVDDAAGAFQASRSDDAAGVGARELVDALRGEVEFLRGELTARTEELRRKDHIIAALTDRLAVLAERIPAALPAGRNASAPPFAPPSATDAPEATRSPFAASPPARRRPRWRRLLGRSGRR